MRLPLLALALALPAAAAHAQIGLYATFSAQDFHLPHIGYQYGTTFGAYDDHWHLPFLALGLDGRGSVVGSGANTTASGFFGPRVSFRPPVLPHPYVEALAGVGHANYGEGSASTSATEFTYQLLAGADWTILPRLDWRVLEFSYGSFTTTSLQPRTLSTGLVLRLP